ncbi:MAG: AbrB/MazE/SpoVT family DNA-binding domain-containing protein [Microcoleus sp.]|jgi:antitoxin MazE
MSKSIQTRIVKIGNSQGICIPKSLLEQIGICGEVEIEVEGDRIVICAARKPRAGWEEAFAKMAEQHDDVLLDGVSTTEWEGLDWQW